MEWTVIIYTGVGMTTAVCSLLIVEQHKRNNKNKKSEAQENENKPTTNAKSDTEQSSPIVDTTTIAEPEPTVRSWADESAEIQRRLTTAIQSIQPAMESEEVRPEPSKLELKPKSEDSDRSRNNDAIFGKRTASVEEQATPHSERGQSGREYMARRESNNPQKLQGFVRRVANNQQLFSK